MSMFVNLKGYHLHVHVHACAIYEHCNCTCIENLYLHYNVHVPSLPCTCVLLLSVHASIDEFIDKC